MSFQLERHPDNPILLPNAENDWEAGTVFNPGIVAVDGVVHMLYRATPTGTFSQDGTFESSIGYASSEDGVNFERSESPVVTPTENYERGLGCEDPRIVRIDGEYHVFYTAAEANTSTGSIQTRVAYATSQDLSSFHKHGIVGPDNARTKAAAIFPETDADGRLTLLMTYLSDGPMSSIVAVKFNEIDDLKSGVQSETKQSLVDFDTSVVLQPNRHRPVLRGPELGAPPIKTDYGWLLVYCGANHTEERSWTINAALVDASNQQTVIARLPDPILAPEMPYERSGTTQNVTFPSGAYTDDDELYVYYGAGDSSICLATCSISELLEQLMQHKTEGSQRRRSYD